MGIRCRLARSRVGGTDRSSHGSGPRKRRSRHAVFRCGLLTTVCLLAAAPAWAGLGGYVEYGLVQYAANWMDDGFVQDGDQAHAIGVGVAWDSNLAKDELLNYRFLFGYRHLEPSEGDDDLRLDGLSAQFTLGFSPLRSENMRWWLGPSIGVSYLICEDCAGPGNDSDVHQASLGLGPEFGWNYHLDEKLSLSITARYTFESTAQKVYGPVNTIFDRGWQGRPSINFSFFFRADKDQFGAEAAADEYDNDSYNDDY